MFPKYVTTCIAYVTHYSHIYGLNCIYVTPVKVPLSNYFYKKVLIELKNVEVQ